MEIVRRLKPGKAARGGAARVPGSSERDNATRKPGNKANDAAPGHTRERPMEIAPAILRLKPEPDASQQQVIGHNEGPMLVIAGPGSGKTGSIQLRAVNLLLTGRTNPGELVLCTFGRDAARQLQRRFTSSALACGVPGDLSRVNITTIHSLCHRLLKPHAALVGLRPGYRVLDDEEQRLLLREESDTVFGPDWDTLSRRGWHGGVRTVDEAARYFDRICDELVDPEDLVQSERAFIAALGRCCLRYRRTSCCSDNAVDFAHLQVWAHRVMQDDGVAAAARADVRHLMVDEFQDTSRVQMRILERLAGVNGNIVAVGDDDQSIYRFRGRQRGQPVGVPPKVPGLPCGEVDHQLPFPPGYRCRGGSVDELRHPVEV